MKNVFVYVQNSDGFWKFICQVSVAAASLMIDNLEENQNNFWFTDNEIPADFFESQKQEICQNWPLTENRIPRGTFKK